MRSYPAVVTHPQEQKEQEQLGGAGAGGLLTSVVCAVSAPCVAVSASAFVSWLHANEAWVPERCWKLVCGFCGMGFLPGKVRALALNCAPCASA